MGDIEAVPHLAPALTARDTASRPDGLLIVMAGLPATGKTSLGVALCAACDAVLLSKDEIRAAAFPPKVIDYSAAQDDLAMEMLYSATRYIFGKIPSARVIVDGRTFTKGRHVARVVGVAADIGVRVRFVECVCDDLSVRARLAESVGERSHIAGNRDWRLYERLRAQAEPLQVERVVVDTGKLSVKEATQICVKYLFGQRDGGQLACP